MHMKEDDGDLLFYLNEKEQKSYEQFKSNHCGIVELIILFTEIGTKVDVHCKGCGTRVDISDYDCW